MKKEKRISYQAGITRKPSDFLCQDGELAECVNLTSDGEELKVMPSLQITKEGNGKKLLFVHKLPNIDDDNWIYEGMENGSLWLWCNGRQLPGSAHDESVSPVQITGINNTLSVIIDNQLTHYLWQGTEYKNIGSLPNLEIKPTLSMGSGYIYGFGDRADGCWSKAEGEAGETITVRPSAGDFVITSGVGYQEKYNDLVVGLYAETLKKLAQRKRFAKPFFVRAALEMYDGTYTQITNPILMWPTIDGCTVGEYYGGKFTVLTPGAVLNVSQTTDYTDYADLVKDVVIFVSDGINVYDTTIDQTCQRINGINSAQWLGGKGIYLNSATSNDPAKMKCMWVPQPDNYQQWAYCLTKRPWKEVVEDVTSTSRFYKLCSIGLGKTGSESNGWTVSLDAKIDVHTLENLTNQTLLTRDDFYSRCPLTCNTMYAYNGRLNITGIKRGFFKGFKTFMPWDFDSGVHTYDIYVTIKAADGKNRVVHHNFKSSERIVAYFYYPDPRATHVKVYVSDNHVVQIDADLKEHPGLNGAYYFNENFPDTPVATTPYSSLPAASDVDETAEGLGSQLMQSQVNNPFTFLSDGSHQVSVGRILAMTSVTMALSQDQFGRTDLLVFTDNGIWGMQVDKEGLYDSCHPLSREVCMNPGSIVQTDKAVFFVSAKGLMVVDENGRVACVSDHMNGRLFGSMPALDTDQWSEVVAKSGQHGLSFRDFLLSASCCIAYDYVDSRLLMFISGSDFCWAYSLNGGGFSKMTLDKKVLNVVNSYPDYLLQDEDSSVYSLYDKAPEENVDDRRLGVLLTRPMKLGGPLTVSSLRELVNVGMWDETRGSVVKSAVFVSDNLHTWHLAGSRFGAAAKYWRLELFVKMLPSERLSGTIIREEERRTENLRR